MMHVLAGLMIVVGGLAVWVLAPRLMNLKSEYQTADVIRATEAFVRAHPGEWPRSWTDLGMDNQDALTRMNFSLQPKHATKEDVLAAIQPLNGKYYTFPHSGWMLENVYAEMTNGLQSIEPSAAPMPSPPAVP